MNLMLLLVKLKMPISLWNKNKAVANQTIEMKIKNK